MNERRIGRPRRYEEGSVHTALRLPRDLRDRLDAECDRRLISRNLVIIRAAEEWLARNEEVPDPVPPVETGDTDE